MSKMCTEYKTVLSSIEYRGTGEFHDLSVELFGHRKDLLHADTLPDDPKNIGKTSTLKQARY